MAYQVYTTEAIVCGSRARGNADQALWLFTRDAGMIIARAASARETRSKLRYALQDFSLLTVSLVRGKHDWRVTGVEPRENLYFLSQTRSGRKAVRSGVQLIRRLIYGEEAQGNCFAVASDGLYRMATAPDENTEVETLFALRMLHSLGYIDATEDVRPLLEAATLAESEAHLKEVSMLQPKIRKMVADALDASQL